MPNGDDRSWIRLCAAIDGFRSRYGHWPTRVRLFPVALEAVEHLLGPVTMDKVRGRIELFADEAPHVAEDAAGNAYDFGKEGFGPTPASPDARAWLTQ